MKSMHVLIALALGAAPVAALAQEAAQQIPASSPEDVGKTGTGTGTVTATGADVGTTGTGTGTATTTDTGSDVGKTGTGTGTIAASFTSVAPSPWTLQVQSSSMVAPGSMTVTAVLPGELDAATESTASYSVPLASSDPACTVPASVQLQWSSSAGALASFQVDCAQVDSDRTVTITGGTAAASFTLNR